MFSGHAPVLCNRYQGVEIVRLLGFTHVAKRSIAYLYKLQEVLVCLARPLSHNRVRVADAMADRPQKLPEKQD